MGEKKTPKRRYHEASAYAGNARAVNNGWGADKLAQPCQFAVSE